MNLSFSEATDKSDGFSTQHTQISVMGLKYKFGPYAPTFPEHGYKLSQ